MNTLIENQADKIHASPTMAVVALTGGGAQALSWLLGTPGASRTILEAVVPYSTPALAEFLGRAPEQTVSPETATDMAHSAFDRARRLSPGSVPVVGIGCTAAIATDRPRRGERRCFVSVWTDRTNTTYGIALVNKRARAAEDKIVSKLVLRALSEASGVGFDLDLPLDDRERVVVTRTYNGDPIEGLLAGHVGSVTIGADGSQAVDEPFMGGVLPGSFDPLHEGHEALAEVAASMLEADVIFEMSVLNVDKPPLEIDEVRKRIAQFIGERSVVVTRTPRFYQKAELFPNCTFVIGWDTAVRLVEPKYYSGDQTEMLKALTKMRRTGCRFLVAGRLKVGVFRTLADVPVPTGFVDMFTELPEADFRRDVSSTELRVAAGRPS